MYTKIYTSLSESILKEWELLWERSPQRNYTNSPLWLEAAVESFQIKKFVIVAVYKNSKLTAICGLINEFKFGRSVYTVAMGDFACGSPFLLDKNDKESITAFFTALSTIGIVYFENVPEKDVQLMQSNDRQIKKSLQTINLYMSISRDAEGRVEIPNRNKLMKQIRLIEEKFVLRSEFASQQKALDIIFALDQQSRKQNRGYNTFANQDIRDFFAALGVHYKDKLGLNILYFNKKPIAYEIGFHINNSYFGNQIAYLSEYSQYSPGKVLLVKLIESFKHKNIQIMNFGSGDNYLKRLFTTNYQNLNYVVLSQNSFTRSYLVYAAAGKNYLYNRLHTSKTYQIYKRFTKGGTA